MEVYTVNIMQYSPRQQDIIRAACTILREQGIEELTTKNLAQTLAVSEPALYRHFESKTALLDAIAAQLAAVCEASWIAARKEGGSATAVLVSFFVNQAMQFESFPPASILLDADILLQKHRDILARIHTVIEENQSGVRRLLEEAVQQKQIVLSCSCDVYACMLIGGFRLVVSSWMRNSRREAGSPSLTHTAKTFTETALGIPQPGGGEAQRPESTFF